MHCHCYLSCKQRSKPKTAYIPSDREANWVLSLTRSPVLQAPGPTAAMDINTAIELQFAIGNEHTIPITICFELAASTLFLYDYILTIRQEANCIWRRPKSLASVLFILCRYVVLVERTMMTVVMVYAGVSSLYATSIFNADG
ncbi:hypothetical protein BDW22DRAFT_1349760 [Trametopsis cervina]|nr:hypothetical protein BDW22DRAFT_1349760 [Trametopsis cervina]